MLDFFDIKNISCSPSILNQKKMDWINAYYMRHTCTDQLVKYFILQTKEKNFPLVHNMHTQELVDLYKNRSKSLSHMLQQCAFAGENFCHSYQVGNLNFSQKEGIKILHIFQKKILHISKWIQQLISESITQTVDCCDVKQQVVYSVIRFAVIGTLNSPNLSKLLFILGKACILKRIKIAEEHLLRS